MCHNVDFIEERISIICFMEQKQGGLARGIEQMYRAAKGRYLPLVYGATYLTLSVIFLFL